jgi:hypothetical protein
VAIFEKRRVGGDAFYQQRGEFLFLDFEDVTFVGFFPDDVGEMVLARFDEDGVPDVELSTSFLHMERHVALKEIHHFVERMHMLVELIFGRGGKTKFMGGG